MVRRARESVACAVLPAVRHLGTLDHLQHTGVEHSWFILNRALAGKEFALSGSEQNLDLTERRYRDVLKRPITAVQPSVQAFLDHGEDWLTADTIGELVAKMNELTPHAPLDPAHVERQVVERDRQVDNAYTKDAQVAAIRVARGYRGDRPDGGPSTPSHPRPGSAARSWPCACGCSHARPSGGCTPTSAGGCSTPRVSRCPASTPRVRSPGSGVAAHGYRALEDLLVGGCLFSGRAAGRAAAEATS